MSSSNFSWGSGNFTSIHFLATILLVIVGYFLGNLPLVILFDGSVEPTMPNLVSYFGSTWFFVLEMLPFIGGLLGFFLGIRFLLKSSLLPWLSSRPSINVKRIFFSFGIWALLIALPIITEWIFFPNNLVLNFKFLPFLESFALLAIFLPFQVLFEELLFRSFILQGLIKRTQSAIAGILVSGIMFGMMHIANPEVQQEGWWLLSIYISLGIVLSFIAYADQGIELSYGFHLANNLFTGLLVTSSDQAFQTNAIFKTEHIQMEKISVITLAFSLILFVFVMWRRYQWDWFGIKNNK
jgi:uncharacterized protein